MPIVSSDIKYYLSGGVGNTDPDASLGGGISTTEASTDLFDDVTSAESSAGDTEYRCIYVKNTHGTLTLESAVIWIETNTPSSDTTVAIALGGEGLNGTAETVGNENTAPSGESFSSPATKGAGLSLGNITAGSYYPVWIRRTITSGAAAYSNDGFTLRVEGDTAA
jgi:hypothetical protein